MRALVLADNRPAELAGWDPQLLAAELGFLSNLDLSFEVGLTGFDNAEIDIILEETRDKQLDCRANDVPTINFGENAITRHGDLWLLGEHRLLCGGATSAAAYDTLMSGAKAQMVVTDPPFNVPISGNACGLGSISHREFAMASGEMSEAEFISFLEATISNLSFASLNGSLHFIFMDWRHLFELQSAARPHYTEQKNLLVWNKTNGGMGSMYRSKHELIGVFKLGKASHSMLLM